MMQNTPLSSLAKNRNDEHGIFLSILYLAGEAHKRKMILTTATLLTAAQSLIDDAEGMDTLPHDLSAILSHYKQAIKKGDYGALERI